MIFLINDTEQGIPVSAVGSMHHFRVNFIILGIVVIKCFATQISFRDITNS
jgi:hypothetical protein